MEKDLNNPTYSIDICREMMSEARYDGLRLIPSNSANNEMMKHGMTLHDCVDILQNGYDAPRRRKQGCIEKWINKGRKVYNIVIVKSVNYASNEEIYLIKHIGRFTRWKV